MAMTYDLTANPTNQSCATCLSASVNTKRLSVPKRTISRVRLPYHCNRTQIVKSRQVKIRDAIHNSTYCVCLSKGLTENRVHGTAVNICIISLSATDVYRRNEET